MADKSSIEWTDATWNPITGCAKVSQGCKHCYAERDWPRMSANPKTIYFDREFTDVRCHPERLDQPLRWTKPRRIFVNSMSDLFHPDVPFQFIADIFAVMSCTTRHTYQVLTNRSKQMLEFFAWLTFEQQPWFGWPDQVDATRVWPQWTPNNGGRGGYDNCGPSWPLENVWLGVSVEDQAAADERIPLLLQTPAAVRWVSAEPLLGPVDLTELEYGDNTDALLGEMVFLKGNPRFQKCPAIDWVVAGGESGPNARPMHPAWARSLRDQCAAAGVPFLFKQWGEWSPEDAGETPHRDTVGILPSGDCAFMSSGYVPPWDQYERLVANGFVRLDGRTLMDHVGKKRAGRLLDEVQHDGYPEAKR